MLTLLTLLALHCCETGIKHTFTSKPTVRGVLARRFSRPASTHDKASQLNRETDTNGRSDLAGCIKSALASTFGSDLRPTGIGKCEGGVGLAATTPGLADAGDSNAATDAGAGAACLSTEGAVGGLDVTGGGGSFGGCAADGCTCSLRCDAMLQKTVEKLISKDFVQTISVLEWTTLHLRPALAGSKGSKLINMRPMAHVLR